jgi:hypothetical protein
MSAKKQATKVLNEILDEVNSIQVSIAKGANVDYEDIQEFDFIALRLSNIQRKLDKQISEPATLK